MKKPIIVIAGPTASGKTTLAINLAQKFKGEIVNADSRSVYREMDIATSKPSALERQQIRHHLIDVVNPDEPFSLSDYKALANEAIADIHNRDKIPFLVGGTGLYLDAIIYDYGLIEVKPNPTLRSRLEKLSTPELAKLLKSLDPMVSEKIDQKNSRRLIRAIEIATQIDKPLSGETKKEKPTTVLYLAIKVPRDQLYERINERVDQWEDQGLVSETKELTKNYSIDLPSLSAIGYQEISNYLDDKISLCEALEIMKKRTRHYAKRQITWFKRNNDLVYIENEDEATAAIEAFLKLT